MLTVLKDAQGQLLAACDWWLVDELGQWTPNGRYVFINQLEISPGANLHQIRWRLVGKISVLTQGAVGVYWIRRDKAYQRPHAFRREQLMQLREEVTV